MEHVFFSKKKVIKTLRLCYKPVERIKFNLHGVHYGR